MTDNQPVIVKTVSPDALGEIAQKATTADLRRAARDALALPSLALEDGLTAAAALMELAARAKAAHPALTQHRALASALFDAVSLQPTTADRLYDGPAMRQAETRLGLAVPDFASHVDVPAQHLERALRDKEPSTMTLRLALAAVLAGLAPVGGWAPAG